MLPIQMKDYNILPNFFDFICLFLFLFFVHLFLHRLFPPNCIKYLFNFILEYISNISQILIPTLLLKVV